MILLLFHLGIMVTPQVAYADFGDSGLESRMENLQNKFINIILPLMSILGLAYAGVLAASGNEGAKAKMFVILLGSAVGFLAPHIIGWIKGTLN